MKTNTRYGLLLFLFALCMPGVLAAQFYDVNPFSMTTANTDTVAFGMRFRINSTIPMNLTGSIRDAGSTPTHALFYNGTPAWSGAQSFCPTGSLANVSFSGDVATIPGGIRVNPNETWTICTTANGASRSAQYSGAVTGNTTGNSTLIIYDCSLYAACQTTNWFEQQGVTIANASSTVPVINIITVNLSNAVNGSSWVNTTTFSNVTGTLTFTYFNITKDGFCVTYTGNGTGTNCTAENGASTYFNVTNTTSITGTQVVIASTYQALLNISAYKLFLNTTIATFNTTNNAFKNVSGSIVYALNGSNNLQIDVAGNYTKNITCTITTPLTTGQCNATGIYDNQYTIGAKNTSNNGISTFNVTVENSTLGGLLYSSSTTNGSLVFNLLQGYQYYFSMNATGYALANTTLPTNASTHLYNFSVFTTNSFELAFYNESTDTLITNATITVQLISDSFANNYTTNNSRLNVTLLTPGDYTIRYWREASVPRDYYVTLTPQSYNVLSLYLVDSDVSNVYIPVVYNENTRPITEATIQLMRYFVTTNSYKVVEMTKTDTNGQGVLRVVPNVIGYRLLISKSGTSTTTAPTKFTASTNAYTLSFTSNSLTSIAGMPSVSKSLTFNNATNTYIFTWTDTTNLVEQGCLVVNKYNRSGITQVSNACSAGATGSLIYTVTDTNNTRYLAAATIDTTTEFSTYTFGPLTADFTLDTPQEIFGLTGFIILTILLVTVGFMANEHGPDQLIITTIIGMFFIGIVGIVAYAWEAYIGFAILGVIIIYKMYR